MSERCLLPCNSFDLAATWYLWTSNGYLNITSYIMELWKYPNYINCALNMNKGNTISCQVNRTATGSTSKQILNDFQEQIEENLIEVLYSWQWFIGSIYHRSVNCELSILQKWHLSRVVAETVTGFGPMKTCRSQNQKQVMLWSDENMSVTEPVTADTLIRSKHVGHRTSYSWYFNPLKTCRSQKQLML